MNVKAKKTKPTVPAITARQLLDMLAEKHREDVFVPECKDGPSQGDSHFRLDAWVMKKSWANPLTIGYETKVSRSDFVNDDKWHCYLQYCNEFSFVCPTGLIQPDELPSEVGLYWATPNATRLYLKKKAVWRDVEISETLYRYILMCRATIGRPCDVDANAESHRAEARQKIEELRADKELGGMLAYEMRRHIDKRVEEIVRENEKLKWEAEAVQNLKGILNAAGFEVNNSWESEALVQRYRDAIDGKVPALFLRLCRDMHKTIGELLKEYDQNGMHADKAI